MTSVPVKPTHLDQCFTPAAQKPYMEMLQQRGGLTRRRAECFVRLWSYLVLKHLAEAATHLPQFEALYSPPDYISCTHREASELFYGDSEQGSDRAAGLMIDKLVALGLMDKKFDGQTLCLRIRDQPELVKQAVETPPEIFMDDFDPVADAVPTAQIMTRSFYEMVKDSAFTAHKISKCLRQWGSIYAGCIKVLRRSDTHNPVGVIILYPTTATCEPLFFGPPSKGFFLTNDRPVDPFEMAKPGDPDCTSIYVRSWIIDQPYLNTERMCLLIQSCQETLRAMKQDYPALCDMYSMIIHPSYEQLREVMGFEKIAQDPQRAYAWVYLAIERYLALDPQKTVAALTSGLPSTKKE
jgi:hypothetical protein